MLPLASASLARGPVCHAPATLLHRPSNAIMSRPSSRTQTLFRRAGPKQLFATRAANPNDLTDEPDAMSHWKDLFAIRPKERKVKAAGKRAALPDMDHTIAPDHSWKSRAPQFGARSSERPQDNSYGDEVGDWELDQDGDPKWKSAEHRRRHFI